MLQCVCENVAVNYVSGCISSLRTLQCVRWEILLCVYYSSQLNLKWTFKNEYPSMQQIIMIENIVGL